MNRTYVGGMIHRLVTVLAALAFAIVTTAAVAHVARMSDVPDFGMHAVEMVQAEDIVTTPCGGDQHSGAAMAGFCAFASVGLTGIVTPPETRADPAFGAIRHTMPTVMVLSGAVPAQAERPPQARLV
ncbi:MAG: hypothetical protein K0B00_13810 [Rhodobacteraceae bacterium]|nr:hypothetical protein [Paracoccaceae bacterium]